VGCLFIYLVICIVVLCVWIKWLDFFLFSLFLFLGRYKGRGWGGGGVLTLLLWVRPHAMP
jgi:hypothetical protein